MGLQGCATLAFYTSLSTSRFAIVLRGTLSQDDIVDAGSLLGQVRDLELLTMIIDSIYSQHPFDQPPSFSEKTSCI
jgi:hypothetical protein